MEAAGRRFTLVIDAGHGGTDHGAPGAYSKEKNLTLKYSLAFGKMVERNCPDVKVVYTRRSDTYLTLKQRADIANRAKADLFVSVHINAVEGGRNVRGFQSYTLGRGTNSGDRGIRENLDVAKRENSVIFLEKDYKTTYKGFDPNSAESDIMFEFIADKNRERSVELSRLMQREVCRATGRIDAGLHQNNFAVLRLTSMPSVLLELGFISTPDEEDYLNSDAGLEQYVNGIYNAFILYKNRYDDNIKVPYRNSNADRSGQLVPIVQPSQTEDTVVNQSKNNDVPTPVAAAVKPATVATPAKSRMGEAPVAKVKESSPVFKIQIFASSSKLKNGDKRFKGLEGCEYYEEGGMVKYTYGASNNYNEIYRLRKEIVEQFPQCFIIAFKNGAKMNVNEGIREFKSNR